MIKRTIAISAVIFIGNLQLFSQQIQYLKGKVFNDKNKNLVYDAGEEGIPNVMVSNQEDVVLTDKEGNYKIPIYNDKTTIFITKPKDFLVPVNEYNIPQFFYIHQPDGSPDLLYKGLAPTGSLPAVVNFPLYETASKDTFNILVFADTQTASREEIMFMKNDIINDVVGIDCEFGITLGDIVHDDLSLFEPHNKIVGQVGIPFYNVIGNHDVDYDADNEHSADTYKRHFGANYYSFDYGNAHIIALDNIERFGKKGVEEKWWDYYRGKIGEKQLKWLENDLKYVSDDKLIIISMHIPVDYEDTEDAREKIEDKDKFFNVIKDKDNLLLIAGHNHTLEHVYFAKEQGWRGKKPLHQIICASVSGTWWTGPKDERGIPSATQIDGVPNGYFVLNIQNNKYEHTFSPASCNKQVRIEFPVDTIAQSNSIEIVVNVFNSNKKSKVYALLDDNYSIELTNKRMKDPYITKLFEKHRAEFKSWSSPSISSQMWVGTIDEKIEKGVHKILVKTIDEFNRTFEECKIFEVK